MKNINWSQLNIILTIMIGTAVLIGILAGVLCRKTDEPEKVIDSIGMNDAWIVDTEDEFDTSANLPCKLETPKGEAVSISHFLPEELGTDYAIAFRSVYNTVQVKAGDQVIYQYGVEEQRPFIRVPVPKWNVVSIDSEYAGQMVTITQISEYGKYSGLFTEVESGSRSALIYRQWCRYGWGILISVVLLILVIGLLIVAVTLNRPKKPDLRFRYYLLFTAVIVIWMISGSPLLSVVTGREYFFWVLHILMRMILPVAYLMLMRSFLQNKRLIAVVDVGIICAGVVYVGIVVLQLMGLLEFAVTYDGIGMIYGVGFLLYTLGMLYGWIKYKRKELRLLTTANILLCIAAVVNLFVRPNHLYQMEGTFWMLSVMLYCFLLLAAVMEAVLLQMNQKVQSVEDEYQNQRAVAVTMMNPNFLFASLNTLLSMLKEESGNAAKLVFAFSNYLRYNLNSIREDKMIPFEEELNHIIAYLEIQQIRMPGLRVTVEDKIHDFQVPARCIEAIVENAVKYGIGKNGNQGQVIIRSYERRDSYAIQIVDEGSGFDTDMLYRKHTPTSMKSVREKLEDTLDAVLEITSKPQKGTIATVKIPKTAKS